MERRTSRIRVWDDMGRQDTNHDAVGRWLHSSRQARDCDAARRGGTRNAMCRELAAGAPRRPRLVCRVSRARRLLAAVHPAVVDRGVQARRAAPPRRRAAAGDLVGLRARGRDVYDLWAISIRAPHADETRQAIPELWRDASGAVRAPTPRPRRGYAESPAFSAGTPAYGALRDGYLQAVSATVWGDRPRFETAVAAARSLDPS